MKTYIVSYIGLPDTQYRDVYVWAINKYAARDLADAILLREYGKDNFDCLNTSSIQFSLN